MADGLLEVGVRLGLSPLAAQALLAANHSTKLKIAPRFGQTSGASFNASTVCASMSVCREHIKRIAPYDYALYERVTARFDALTRSPRYTCTAAAAHRVWAALDASAAVRTATAALLPASTELTPAGACICRYNCTRDPVLTFSAVVPPVWFGFVVSLPDFYSHPMRVRAQKLLLLNS